MTFEISIHAPRTGSDSDTSRSSRRGSYFNPRSPHGERRMRQTAPQLSKCYFNPRSPHGERHLAKEFGDANRMISIHAPRTGSDPAK